MQCHFAIPLKNIIPFSIQSLYAFIQKYGENLDKVEEN
jgi:hypothetical protein